jgi:L-alanine-DL-glutamate epimerase-like enolase superfamily enzyme
MNGRGVHNIETNRLFWYRLNFNCSVCIGSAAPDALDMASWDPEARELGAPLRLLFGSVERPRGAPRQRLVWRL